MSKFGLQRAATAIIAVSLAGLGCAGQPPSADGDGGDRPGYRVLQTTASSRGESAQRKKGFVANIERLTVANENYRQVLYTGEHLQLVLMTLQPGEEIGEETHDEIDQFFRVEAGEGEIVINGVSHRISDGSAVIVPAGARHNLRSVGTEPLKLYTLYGPPEHRRDVVQRTKAVAERQHRHFDGKTSE